MKRASRRNVRLAAAATLATAGSQFLGIAPAGANFGYGDGIYYSDDAHLTIYY